MSGFCRASSLASPTSTALVAPAQQVERLPRFEVASIKKNTSDDRARMGGWLDADRYDITAKASGEFQFGPDGPPKNMLLMLRALLEDRFQLKMHHETRELPTYDLVLGRTDHTLGPELHKSNVDCEAVFAARRAGVALPPRGRSNLRRAH